MIFTLQGPDDVVRLRNDPGLRRTLRRIAIAHPAHPASQDLEQRLHRLYFACGCTAGAVCALASTALASALWLTGVGELAWTWWRLLLVALGAALLGKLIGLASSRVRLRRLLRSLESEWRQGPFPIGAALPPPPARHPSSSTRDPEGRAFAPRGPEVPRGVDGASHFESADSVPSGDHASDARPTR